MFNTHMRIGLVALGVLAAGSVFAAGMPSNVTRVDAKVENGKLVVEWDAASDEAGIASYRVYYSRESILENDGNYDDFEQTSDEGTRYEFPRFPYPGQALYVSVLAVNTSGIESEAFEVEARVELPSEDAPAVTQQPTETEPANPEAEAAAQKSMTIASVEAREANKVTVTFSQPIADSQEFGPGFFIVVDENGGILEVKDYAKDGAAVTLTTADQTSGRTYILGVLQRITGQDGAYIDGSAPQARFTGVATEQAVESSASSSSQEASSSSVSTAAAEVYGRNPYLATNTAVAGTATFLDLLRNRSQGNVMGGQQAQYGDTVAPENPASLRLQPVLRSDGTYNVTAEWRGSPDTARDLQGYMVAISQDGSSYVPSSTTDANQRSVQYSRLEPGIFGVRVSAFDRAGNRSTGIQNVVTLPESGLGLLGIAAVSGVAAARRLRRKRTV